MGGGRFWVVLLFTEILNLQLEFFDDLLEYFFFVIAGRHTAVNVNKFMSFSDRGEVFRKTLGTFI